MITINIGVQ